MRLLVTGADGQLGRALQEVERDKVQIIPLPRSQLDITNPDAIDNARRDCRPDVVVNAAAYTAVDRAEANMEAAYKVNRDGPAMLAAACATADTAFIHISTDFVFDGDLSRPYRSEDRTNPLNIYGASKLAGEAAVLRAMPDALIIRTSWLYAPWGRNFVTSMLRLLREKESARVVADQYGSPTSATSLAEAIATAGEKLHGRKVGLGASFRGIWHYADAGIASWYELAIAVRDEGAAAGIISPSATVDPIGTVDYPTPARRPPFSALDSTELRGELHLPETHWRDAVTSMFRRYSGPLSEPFHPHQQVPVEQP